jgi:hypothetical protein
MPTERVTLELDATALYVARAAAEAANLSLSDWISRVARAQGVREGAAMSAEQDRLHPDEPPGWAEHTLKRMFAEGEE